MDVDESDRAAVAQREMELLGLNSLPSRAGPMQASQDDWQKWEDQLQSKNWGADEPSKWRKAESKGTGRSYGGWGPKRKTPEQEEKEKALDKKTQQLLQLMTRMTLRHEKELSRLRADTSFVMFCDVGDHGCLPQLKATAENWQEQYAAQKVTTSLKVIMMLSLLKALQQNGPGDHRPGDYGEVQDSGLALRGSKRPRTVLELLGVEQHRKKGAGCLGSSNQTPGGADHPRQAGAGGSSAGHPHRLQEHQGHGRQAKRSGAVLDQHWPEAGGYGRSSCRPAKTIRMLLHEASGMQTSARPGTAPSAGEADRGSVQSHDVLRLGRTSQSVEDLGRSSTGVPRSARLSCLEAQQLPVAKLRNPDNLCYANSVLQAFYWGGVMTRHPAESYGLIQAGVRILAQPGTPYLPQCLHLQSLFRGWRNLHRQHDVAEFHKHVLEVSQASVYVGAWESRLTNPHAVTDGGSLQTPVLLHFPGRNLTELIHAWHQQYAKHALRFHSGLLTLQICRFVGTNKYRQPLTIAAGECLRLPIFAEPQGTAMRWESFWVIWVIFHIGSTVDSGHYQTAISVQCPDNHTWSFKICNDALAPKDPSHRDLQHVARDGYLVGLHSAHNSTE